MINCYKYLTFCLTDFEIIVAEGASDNYPRLGSNLTLSLNTNITANLWWSYRENGSPITSRLTGTSNPLVFSPIYLANGTKTYYKCAQIDPYIQCKACRVFPQYDWGKLLYLCVIVVSDPHCKSASAPSKSFSMLFDR